MVMITVTCGDIITQPCDLLILKHADGFHGVDKKISQLMKFSAHIPNGEYVFSRGYESGAREILYLGVGPLETFRYEKIRAFASRALKVAANRDEGTRKICSPVHGPGFGLDDQEAFLSLIGGFLDAIENGTVPETLRVIEIVENNPTRARRFQSLLNETQTQDRLVGEADYSGQASIDVTVGQGDTHGNLISFGAESEHKPRLFVAMPHAEQYSDVWDIAIQDACVESEIVCERVKEDAYVGDIVQEIRKRVNECHGFLAVLNGANPNVFLELGYAWALEKPTVLIVDAVEKLPFDVQGQRCLVYKSINDLRTQLTRELKGLKKQGLFDVVGKRPR